MVFWSPPASIDSSAAKTAGLFCSIGHSTDRVRSRLGTKDSCASSRCSKLRERKVLMADIKTGKKAKEDPVEKPKKLPAEFPEKFDTEQRQKDSRSGGNKGTPETFET